MQKLLPKSLKLQVILAIIGVSLIPVLLEALAARKEVAAIGADPRDAGNGLA